MKFCKKIGKELDQRGSLILSSMAFKSLKSTPIDHEGLRNLTLLINIPDLDSIYEKNGMNKNRILS